jgi:hypothetical protein
MTRPFKRTRTPPDSSKASIEEEPMAVQRYLTGALLVALTLAVAPQAQARQVEGSFQRTVSVSGPTKIDIVSGSGRIEVRPGTAGRVEISGRIRASDRWGFRSRRSTAEERVRRVEANPPIEQSAGLVRIGHLEDDDLREGVSISYTVTVPPDSTLVSKTGSGSQEIAGVTGDVEASSGSGSIAIRDAGGSVRTSAGSGGITVDSVGGAFRATTGSGSIKATGVKGSIYARSGSGGIEVTQDGSGDVDVSASSGSVRLRGVQGGVRASTSSGGLSIQGRLAGDWRLSSSSGSIRVALPENQGFELDAHSSSGHIETDFPVTVTGMMQRRTLRGAAQGGGSLLHLRTSSGGIEVRRGVASMTP